MAATGFLTRNESVNHDGKAWVRSTAASIRTFSIGDFPGITLAQPRACKRWTFRTLTGRRSYLDDFISHRDM